MSVSLFHIFYLPASVSYSYLFFLFRKFIFTQIYPQNVLFNNQYVLIFHSNGLSP